MTGVSFVVTVYNKEPFLPGVLGALFAQEGDFAREYVIVDDGSTDGSYALIERLCAGREDVRLIRQRNAGPAVATNVGVRAARHPWLKIVDADDVLAPWCTRLMLEAAMRLDLRLAHGSGILYRLGEKVDWGKVDPARVRPWRRDLFPHCLRNVPANLSVTLIDRALFWEVGGCDERIFTQDYSLLLRLCRRSPVAEIDVPISASPVEAPGRVSADQAGMLRDTNAVILRFLAETDGLSWRERHTAIERAFGRAWKWQRRKLGTGLWSRWFWLYALAKLGPPELAASFLPATLGAFGEPAVAGGGRRDGAS
jgi:hypothetical protein